MEADRQRWNDKYARATDPASPDPWVVAQLQAVEEGRALDIACGRGRHSLVLADLGYEVDALDISEVGLAAFEHAKIHKHRVDLDDFQIEANRYDVILNTCFLDTAMWPHIIAGLRCGGRFLAIIATRTNAHIKTSRFKLEPGQLRAGFEALVIEQYYEADGYAYLRALKSAVSSSSTE